MSELFVYMQVKKAMGHMHVRRALAVFLSIYIVLMYTVYILNNVRVYRFTGCLASSLLVVRRLLIRSFVRSVAHSPCVPLTSLRRRHRHGDRTQNNDNKPPENSYETDGRTDGREERAARTEASAREGSKG